MLVKITINEKWCKKCSICVAFCPTGVYTGKDCVPQIVSPEKCINCQLCVLRCPDFAIKVEKV